MPLRDFVPYYYHATFGGNWTRNKGKTEGATMCPPAYMVPKYPSLNRAETSLQYKTYGRDKRLIKNWRPISLLNVDAKVISKCLANCAKTLFHL